MQGAPAAKSVSPLARPGIGCTSAAGAGPRVAAIASVIESSKRLGINPREYLADVLRRLTNGTTSEVPSLTPAA